MTSTATSSVPAENSPRALGVTVTRDAGIAVVTISDGRNNALSASAYATIHQALSRVVSDPGVTAVVLTSGARCFSVGADLSTGPASLLDLIEQDGADEPGWFEPAGRLTALIRSSRVPVVAAVDGSAIGGGATMCLGADVRVASPTTRFAFPFGRVGVVPEGGCTWLLPRLVGMARAIDWLGSGRLVLADEALTSGLVSEIVPSEELVARAIVIARTVGESTSPTARRRTLELLDQAMTGTFDASRRLESDAMRAAAQGDDAREGIIAYNERRAPNFLPFQERE